MSDCRRASLSYHVPNFARSWLAYFDKVHFNKQVITGSFRVKMALEGYKRMSARQSVRRPLSLRLLRRLVRPDVPLSHRACFLLSYVFLLRVSETVAMVKGAGSLAKVRRGYTIFLQSSKADPESRGVSVFFKRGDVPPELLPLLDNVVPQVTTLPCPSPADLNGTIHAKLGSTYSFHCLRHGRATDMFASGTPLSRLMVMGRWATKAAVTCYLH